MQIPQVALLLYICLAIYLFQSMDRVRATATSLLIAELFLPERIEFDLPLLPPFDKHSISSLVAFVMVMTLKKHRIPGKEGILVPLVIANAVIGCLGTFLTNRDPLILSEAVVNYGLGFHDFISMLSSDLLFIILPFWLGKTVFTTREDVTRFLKIFTTFGIVYALFMLVEIRMSPQMNVWVYGYRQHSWLQGIRGGGYRPMVFMAHGLATTLFCATCVLSAVTLANAKEKLLGTSPLYFAGFLFLVLSLSNSLGSLVYGVVVTPLLWIGRPRLLAFVASSIAVLVLSIPVLRTFAVLPLDEIIAIIARFDVDRALSLNFRFEMEEVLVQKATERPFFGWGGFGRSRIFNDSGQDVVVADSAWIIAFGRQGAIGFLTRFLLLLAPIWVCRKHIRSLVDPRERALLSGLALILSVNVFDLLMNGLFSYLPLLLSGVLYGYVGTLNKQQLGTSRQVHVNR